MVDHKINQTVADSRLGISECSLLTSILSLSSCGEMVLLEGHGQNRISTPMLASPSKMTLHLDLSSCGEMVLL